MENSGNLIFAINSGKIQGILWLGEIPIAWSIFVLTHETSLFTQFTASGDF
jgi:hypothetical protein